MIGVIPAAGHGTRLRPFTFYRPKPLMGVGGKTIIEWVVESIKKTGVEEIRIIINPEDHEKFKRYVKENVKFIFQKTPLGLGDAVLKGIEDLGEEEVMILLGDTVVEVPHVEDQFILVKEVEEPERYGIVEIENNRIKRVVEKPKNPPSNLAIIGGYKFKNAKTLKESIKELIQNKVKSKGEIQLTDAIQILIEKREIILPVKVDNFFDCGTPELLLNSNRYLLKGRSVVKTEFIYNSVIGKNVYIENNVIVKNSKIEDSIVLNGARIEDSILTSSIVGEGSRLKGFKGRYMGVGTIEGV